LQLKLMAFGTAYISGRNWGWEWEEKRTAYFFLAFRPSASPQSREEKGRGRKGDSVHFREKMGPGGEK
jgi:hypothetical protein